MNHKNHELQILSVIFVTGVLFLIFLFGEVTLRNNFPIKLNTCVIVRQNKDLKIGELKDIRDTRALFEEYVTGKKYVLHSEQFIKYNENVKLCD